MKRSLLNSSKSSAGFATIATLGSWLLSGSLALAQTAPQAPPPPASAPAPAQLAPSGLPAQAAPVAPPPPPPFGRAPRAGAAPGPGARPPAPPRDGGPLSAAPGKHGPGFSGRIVAVRPYLVQIAGPANHYVTLALHKGTIINPLGTTLTTGMNVRAHGRPQPGGTIATDRIDLLTVAQGPPPPPAGPGPLARPRPLRDAGPPRPEGGSPAPR